MAPGGKAKGKGGAQNASTLREGAAGKKKGGPALVPSRIANAKELRNQFGEVQHSPDGIDPQPQTVPKCVECAHCLWPVYPRDSRVATRKTFERAGIQRDYGDKAAAADASKKKTEAAAEAGVEEDLDIGDDEDEKSNASGDSIGTVEMLESKVQEQEERIMELESSNNALELEKAALANQVEELEESLAAAEEKIELLEESEMRWREKNSVLRMENEECRLYISRLGSRIGDLETDMVKKLLDIQWRKEKAARDERRRALMLAGLETKMRIMEGAGLVAALFTVWKTDLVAEKAKRAAQEAEERRRREVGELRDQLVQDRHHILSLEATTTRLRGNLKAAAHRMLAKVFSTTQKPWADGHAFNTWAGTTPTLKFENELIRTQKTLKETQEKLVEEEALTAQLTADLETTTANLKATTKDRDELSQNYAILMTELQNHLGSASANATEIQRMAEAKAKAARDALIKEVWAEANKQMDEMRKEFAVERTQLEDQIGGLEAQLESIKRGIGGSAAGDDDTRVVPKGQGILCCGCLKQIVNRGVKQLPPVALPRAKSPSRMEEKQKKSFFNQELLGMPDPDDLLHSEVWKARRDPMAGMRYAGISPDVSFPKSASTSKLLPLQRSREALKFKPSAFR